MISAQKTSRPCFSKSAILCSGKKSLGFFLGALLLVLSLHSLPTHAASTHYVADQFFVPLRSGPSNKYRIIDSSLRTGTALSLVESDSVSGYSKVITPSGKEGWIESQYLSAQPIARILLEREREKTSALQSELKQTKEKRAAATSTSSELERKVSALSSENQKISTELANIKRVSSNAINLDISNRELLQNNEMLKIEISELQSENDRLASKSEKEWFLRGAFAVIIGVVLTIVIPLLKPKPKSNEWT